MDGEKGRETYREFNDAEILYQREVHNRRNFNTLEKGIYIQGQIEKFLPTSLFEGRMGIMLPESFGIMPEAYQKVKYPSHYRPQTLITSKDLSANMGFTLFAQESTEEELAGISAQNKSMLKRANPVIQFYRQRISDTANCRKVWFDFRTQALDEAVYNIQFLALIDGCVMQGMFNCLYRHMNEWHGAAGQMVESVADITKAEK